MLTISRVEAKKRGDKYYLTGFPCKRGHSAWRYTSNGGCSDCLAEDRGQAKIERRHQVRNENLISISFRAYESDWPVLLQTAQALVESEYPSQPITVPLGLRDRTAGTAFYSLRIPPQYAQMMQETAAAMLKTHSPDVDRIRERILGQLLAQADE